MDLWEKACFCILFNKKEKRRKKEIENKRSYYFVLIV